MTSAYDPAEEVVGALSETVTALVEEDNVHVFAFGHGSDADYEFSAAFGATP